MNVKTRKALKRIREKRAHVGDHERVSRHWERERAQQALRPVHPEPRQRRKAPSGPAFARPNTNPPIALRPLRQLRAMLPLRQALRELRRFGHCRALMSARIHELTHRD